MIGCPLENPPGFYVAYLRGSVAHGFYGLFLSGKQLQILNILLMLDYLVNMLRKRKSL